MELWAQGLKEEKVKVWTLLYLILTCSGWKPPNCTWEFPSCGMSTTASFIYPLESIFSDIIVIINGRRYGEGQHLPMIVTQVDLLITGVYVTRDIKYHKSLKMFLIKTISQI